MKGQLAEIGQIAITASDVPRALAFYRDALGLRFLFSPGPTLAFLAAGPVRLMVPRGSRERPLDTARMHAGRESVGDTAS